MGFWTGKLKLKHDMKPLKFVPSPKPKFVKPNIPPVPRPEIKKTEPITKKDIEKYPMPPLLPKIKPKGEYDRSKPEKEFRRIFKELTYAHSAWHVWQDFVFMSACTLSNAVDKSHYDVREKSYLDVIKKYNKKERLLFPELLVDTVMALELNPEQDFLGSLYMELELQNNRKGQFFTPYNVARFMATVSLGELMPQIEKQEIRL